MYTFELYSFDLRNTNLHPFINCFGTVQDLFIKVHTNIEQCAVALEYVFFLLLVSWTKLCFKHMRRVEWLVRYPLYRCFALGPFDFCKYQFLSKIMSALQLIPYNAIFSVHFN